MHFFKSWGFKAILVVNVSFAPVVLAQDCGDACTETIPFDVASDFLIVVKGQVGPLDGLRFILDTGASSSVADRKVADRLQLKRHSGRTMTFDHSIPVEWADIPEIRIGPLREEGIRVTVVDLARYSDYGKSADGILGLDFLSRVTRFTIDYDTRTVEFLQDA
jgi:hypothetical protein